MTLQRSPLPFLMVMLVGLAACSSSEDSPAPTVDTTPPEVVSVTPADAATAVENNAPIQVVFNEDMSPTTSVFGLESNPGELTVLNWTDARTLVISHKIWPDAAAIQMDLTSGLKDVAGNEMAAFQWNFQTIATVPLLVSSLPADQATGVNRNVPVLLDFPTTMNLESVKNATTVDDGTVPFGKLPVGFELDYNSDTQLIMTFGEVLPENTTISIVVGVGATSLAGVPLATPISMSFTTGSDTDTTPPQLLSVEPANGSTIPASTSTIVFTFSEGITDEGLEPSRISAQFFTLYGNADIQADLSPDGTQLTVALPAPLPAELPISVVLNGYSDLAGNLQSEPIEYNVKVAGSGAPWPFVDGSKFQYYGEWETSFEDVAKEFGEEFLYYQVEEQPNGSFYWTNYSDEGFGTPVDASVFQLTSSAIKQIGDLQYENGQLTENVTISPGVEWARLPFVESTWSGTTTVTFDEGAAQAQYTITVLGREDVTSLLSEPDLDVVWLDCWKLTREWTLSVDGEVLETGQATNWYAPSVGVVKTEETVNEEGEIEESVEELLVWLRP